MTEFLGLAASHPALCLGLLLATAIGGVFRRWITHRTAVRHEIETTHRLHLALRGTEPRERAAIVRAYAQLEAHSQDISGR
jgi:hypothetical protein